MEMDNTDYNSKQPEGLPPVGDVPVTKRLVENRATDRFDYESVTDRFADTTPSTTSPFAILAQGDIIEERYRIESVLTVTSGEADVYRCVDMRDDVVVALKLYHSDIKPKESVLQRLHRLQHANIVSLLDYGSWAGRFYEINDFCSGGGLVDYAPYTEEDLRPFIAEIIDGLRYLHTQGIIHRDIKPNNIFFRLPNKEDLVIGDFGVSSMLEMDEKVRKTSTGAFFTLDYAAPELIDGKEVSPKTDYYALGITLLHVLMGHSPFMGMDKNAVLGCHFRGNIPRPAVLSKTFQQLLEGLLRITPETRWGYDQVISWLHNEPVLTDDGVPDRPEINVGKRIPYRSHPDITTPLEMSRRLDEIDVERDIQRGYISQWLMFFDTELGRQVAELEETFVDNPALGVIKLQYLLDPSRPLEVDSLEIFSIGELVSLLASKRERYRNAFETLLYSGSLEVWLDTLVGDDRAQELKKRIADLRVRIPDKILGVNTLLYVLDPSQPFEVTPYHSISSPEELDTVLAQNTNAITHFLKKIYGGLFTEWLRSAFPSRKADIDFMERCVKNFAANQSLGLLAVRAHFNPSLPFKLRDTEVCTPKELASLIQRTPENFDEGVRQLAGGYIRTWLLFSGRVRDILPFDQLVNDPVNSWPRKMEAVLHILDPALPWPHPSADVEALDGGSLSTNDLKTLSICIFNSGRGHLAGTISLGDGDLGFTMEPATIEGEPVTVRVRIHGEGLTPGQTQHNTIVVESNGGRLEIPIFFKVAAPNHSIFWRTAAVTIISGEVWGIFRMMLQTIWPQCRYSLLPWFERDTVTIAEFRGIIPLVVLLLIFTLGGLYFVHRFYRLHQEEDWDIPEEDTGSPQIEDNGGLINDVRRGRFL